MILRFQRCSWQDYAKMHAKIVSLLHTAKLIGRT